MFPPPGSSLVAATIVALVVTPTLTTAAAAVGIDMPWFANAGVAGMCGFLLWWHMERGDKRTAKAMDGVAKAMDSVTAEISGMRDDLKDGQEKTHDLLAKALFPTGGPK